MSSICVGVLWDILTETLSEKLKRWATKIWRASNLLKPRKIVLSYCELVLVLELCTKHSATGSTSTPQHSCVNQPLPLWIPENSRFGRQNVKPITLCEATVQLHEKSFLRIEPYGSIVTETWCAENHLLPFLLGWQQRYTGASGSAIWSLCSSWWWPNSSGFVLGMV